MSSSESRRTKLFNRLKRYENRFYRVFLACQSNTVKAQHDCFKKHWIGISTAKLSIQCYVSNSYSILFFCSFLFFIQTLFPLNNYYFIKFYRYRYPTVPPAFSLYLENAYYFYCKFWVLGVMPKRE